jgi:polyisoprenoid-binding protein YceI
MALAGATLALLMAPTAARADTWELDQTHTQIGFSVKHLMVTNVRGHFKKFDGKIELDEKDPTKSTVVVNIDTRSIDTNEEKRDAHLRNADFFDSDKFPAMTFKSTKVQKLGKNKYKVIGDLTIRGTTKPVVLTVEGPTKPLKDPWGGTRSGLTATGTINRKDFGLTWNTVLEAGGVAVGEEVKLQIEAELIQKPNTQS